MSKLALCSRPSAHRLAAESIDAHSLDVMRSAAILAVVVPLVLVATVASPWDYPEHREIALQTGATLDPERRREFDELWKVARMGSGRLCVEGADTEQSRAPDCIDWAAPHSAGVQTTSAGVWTTFMQSNKKPAHARICVIASIPMRSRA